MTSRVRFDVAVTGAAGAAAALGRIGGAAMVSGSRWRAMGVAARAGGIAVAAGAAAAAAGLKDAVDVEQEFSRSMRLVQANSGATAAQMRELEEAATTMGPKLGFGARESADAMLELAKAGLDADQVIDGGLKGTLTLAAAGATSLATASTIASNAMNSFGLESSEMSRIAGVLAGGANASTASVESLGTALSQVGPGARTAGLDLNRTVAALAAFDNNGIKGSDSGTSLKTMLSRLVPQTDKASAAFELMNLNFTKTDGSFVSLEDMAGQLRAGLADLTAEQRTTALAAAFGSDATRAATVLAREGEAGIRKYIRATKDQGAAQRAIKAETSGTAGALKRLTSETEVARLKVGQALAPSVVKAADALSKRLVPATEDAIAEAREWKQEFERNGIDGVVAKVEKLTDTQGKLSPILDEATLAGQSLWRIVKDLAPAFADAATALPPFLQPLTLAGDVLDTVADAVEAIPDPLKSLAIQAGLVSLVMPRLTAGVASASTAMMVGATRAIGWTQAMTGANTRAATLSATAAKLGGAASTAAGIGGILALTHGMQDADEATSALMLTLGGAAAGFALGGPLGAAIGTGAGAAMALFKANTEDARDVLKEAAAGAAEAKVDYDGLRSTLDELSGATTKSTRAFVQDKLERAGVLDSFAKEGVSRRTVVNAVLGEGRARQEVARFIKGQEDAYSALDQKIVDLGDTQERVSAIGRQKYLDEKHKIEEQQAAIRKTIDTYEQQGLALRAGIADQREAGRVLQDYTGLAGKVPRSLISKLEVKGIAPTVSGIARVVRHYKVVDGKQIQALIGVTGVDTSVGEVRRVVKALNDADQKKADLRAYSGSFRTQMGRITRDAESGGVAIGDGIRKGTRRAKADVSGVAPSVRSGLAPAKSAASSGGSAIGSNIRSGFSGGFAGAAGEWAAQTRGATRAAINAAKAEAEIRSPSRKMYKVGKQLAEGGTKALKESRTEFSDAGADLMRSLVRGIGRERVGIARALDAVNGEVERSTARVKRMQELRASYVSDFRGFATSAFAAQAPTLEDGSTGPQTAANILAAGRAEALRAKQVEAAVRRLTGRGGLGLSADLIQQLRDQGSGGIDQILALSRGSRQDIRRLNRYNAQTNGAYTATGLGLFARDRGNERLADARRDQRQAEALAREVRRALSGLKIEGGTLRLEGSTLVAAIKAEERKNGKKS